ncbi:MAG: 1-deoxy-D-xylulose-5-phosphate synthase [Verrucomicrobia bacterium]|nr:1-deoxy-D-xylulose-5-phosphate synthase [Verrucomicrobiota bacterium]
MHTTTINPAPRLPRDVFLDEIFEAAQRNRDIYLLCADLGAKALDQFRGLLKNQFIHVGISEQNMMDLAAGLVQNGKIVYTYAMAPFVTMRCYEQIKVSLASMNLPTTIIGNGVGFSYDDSGPTHYATEDIACMRSLAGIEIVTPADTWSVFEIARLSHKKPALRYVRLDRAYLPDVYSDGDTRFLKDGIVEIEKGKDLCILACGCMLHSARKARANLKKLGHSIGVVDVFRLKPIDGEILRAVLAPYSKVVTLEEHFLSAGLGGAILEAMADAGIHKKVLRLGIQDHYYCENGGRAHIQRLAGIDLETITGKLRQFLAGRENRSDPGLRRS